MNESLPISNAASSALLAGPGAGGLGEYIPTPAGAAGPKQKCRVNVHYRLIPMQQKLASEAAAIYRRCAQLR